MKTSINLLVALIILMFAISADAQTTEFTYQGTLKDNGAPANANYDFEFALFDAVSVGNQVGATIPKNNLLVTNGVFAVKLDFGSVFPGANRYLEIRVRLTGQPTFTTLSRQLINSEPYSVKSVNSDNATNATNATTATNATQLGGVAANQYVITIDPRMSDSRMPTAGSANYIQNQNSGPQVSSNFNISQTGKASIFDAATQFNINGARLLSNPGAHNLFVGAGAGSVNDTGAFNLFAGKDAGAANIGGSENAFVGYGAGQVSQSGDGNSFFGAKAGNGSNFGNKNTFIGWSAGFNTLGVNANENTFVGAVSGIFNSTSRGNTLIGFGANTTNPGTLLNATAIGNRAFVTQNNSLVLGSINGVNFCSVATDCGDTSVGIGTTNPGSKLHVFGNGPLRITADSDSNAGFALRLNNSPKWSIATVSSGYFTIFNDATAQNALLIDGTTNAVQVPGNLNVTGTISGTGSGLINLNGANITGGTITSTQLSSDALPNSSSLKLLGSQRWDLLKGQASFNVGTSPRGMAFDGSNIWVANGGENTVTKLRASDGACVGTCTFSVGTTPNFLAFDGANIWVANSGSNNVTKLRASDGANLGTFTVGTFPFGITYDGANIWVTNANSNTVTKLRASDGSNQGSFPVVSPGPIVFDGANLWILRGTSGVTKLRPSDGASLCFLSQVDITISLVFDGTYILLGNAGSVTKVKTSDCTSLGFINNGGGAANGIGFDGTNVWATSNDNIVKLRASDGTTLGVFSTGSSPNRFAFDGANMWVTNSNNTVTRMPPAFPQ